MAPFFSFFSNGKIILKVGHIDSCAVAIECEDRALIAPHDLDNPARTVPGLP